VTGEKLWNGKAFLFFIDLIHKSQYVPAEYQERLNKASKPRTTPIYTTVRTSNMHMVS
jgi:hypothetical protein